MRLFGAMFVMVLALAGALSSSATAAAPYRLCPERKASISELRYDRAFGGTCRMARQTMRAWARRPRCSIVYDTGEGVIIQVCGFRLNRHAWNCFGDVVDGEKYVTCYWGDIFESDRGRIVKFTA